MTTFKRLLLALGTLVVLGGAASLLSGAWADQATRPDPATVGGVHGEPLFITKSIGDTITQSTAIVRAKVASFGKPTWNSPTGEDWTEDWRKSPESYEAHPVSATPVEVVVSEVYLSREGAYPGEPAPSVEPGDVMSVLALDTGNLEPGDELVFLASWVPMQLYDGSARSVWFCDLQQATWRLVGGDLLTPTGDPQAYSLAAGADTGRAGITTQDGRGVITIDSFVKLISDELETSAVDVAGFDQWPADAVEQPPEQSPGPQLGAEE